MLLCHLFCAYVWLHKVTPLVGIMLYGTREMYRQSFGINSGLKVAVVGGQAWFGLVECTSHALEQVELHRRRSSDYDKRSVFDFDISFYCKTAFNP